MATDLQGKLKTNDNGRPVAVVRNASEDDIDSELTVYLGQEIVLRTAPIDDPDALREGETAYGKYDLEPGELSRIDLPIKNLRDGEYRFWGESDAEPFYIATVENGKVVNEERDIISDRALRERVRPGGPPTVPELSASADRLQGRVETLERERSELLRRRDELKEENTNERQRVEELQQRLQEKEREAAQKEKDANIDSLGRLAWEAVQLFIGKNWWRRLLSGIAG